MKVYSAAEVAVLTGLNLQTVRKHLREGKLPAKRIGRTYVIDEYQLRKYALTEHRPGRPRKDKGKG